MSDAFQQHLTQGGEFLKADKVEAARTELEAARALRPSDAKVRSLLGLVYFRAQDYPAARAVFVDLAAEQPDDAALRLNLGLVHLKLGETDDAIGALEAAAAGQDKGAARGYLGLAYARAGRYAEARDAFTRAGQLELAREMEAHLAEAGEASGGGGEAEIHLEADMPAPGEAPARAPTASPASATIPPPMPTGMPSMRARAPRLSAPPIIVPPRLIVDAAHAPQPLLELVTSRLIAPGTADTPAMYLGPGGALVLRTKPRCVARAGLTMAAAGALKVSPAFRREKGRTTELAFGIDDRTMQLVVGEGALVLGAPAGLAFTLIALDDDALYLREDHLAAFGDGLRWENGRVPQSGDTVPLVQLRGRGVVALALPAAPVALKLTATLPITVPASRLVGWLGRVVPRLRDEGRGPARVECHGEGAVLVVPDAAPRA